MLRTSVDVAVKIDDKKYKIKVKKLTKKQSKELKERFGAELIRAEELKREIGEKEKIIALLERSGAKERFKERVLELDDLAREYEQIKESVFDELEKLYEARFEMIVDGEAKDELRQWGEEYGFIELVSVIEKAEEEALKKK